MTERDTRIQRIVEGLRSWWVLGLVVSITIHVTLTGVGFFWSGSAASFPPASESVPVDMVSDKDFNEMMKGDKTAKAKMPEPQRRVDKVAETKTDNDPGEAKKDVAAPTPPKAEPKPEPEQKVAVLPPVRPPELRVKTLPPEEPKPVEDEKDAEIVKKIVPAKPDPKVEPKPEPPKVDPLAKLVEEQRLADEKRAADLKKAAEEKKKAAEKKKAEADRKAKEAADAKKLEDGIRNKLDLSKEAPSSTGASGAAVSQTASVGVSNATGKKLSPSERSQLKALLADKIGRCFNNPGSSGPKTLPILRVSIGRDGSLITSPTITNSSNEPTFRSYADATLRATRNCAPYAIPARFMDTYEDWKVLEIHLDLSDL